MACDPKTCDISYYSVGSNDALFMLLTRALMGKLTLRITPNGRHTLSMDVPELDPITPNGNYAHWETGACAGGRAGAALERVFEPRGATRTHSAGCST